MSQIQTFKFQARTKFIAGPGSVQQLGVEIAALGIDKVLLATDQGIINAGLLDSVLAPLDASGIKTTVFDQVAPNPTDQTAADGAALAKANGAQAIIGLGGGSPIDAAKAISVMTTNDGPLDIYCGAGAEPWPNQPLPIIALPTTAGTGAEVSAAGMINLPQSGRKMDIFGASILPQLAIADANLTLSLPPHLTAWTGIDALSHAVEAYLCVGANPLSDAIAEGAIKLIGENLRLVYQDGGNVTARHNMLVASAMAVIAASGAAGLGVIHSLAQTLGGYYDLPHGLTIAVCFPYGLAYNMSDSKISAVAEKYRTVSHLLGDDSAMTLVDTLEQLKADLNVMASFKSMQVRQEDIPQLAEYAMLDGCTPTNPRKLMTEDFQTLFEQGFKGKLMEA